MNKEIEDIAFELFEKKWNELHLTDNPLKNIFFEEVKDKYIKEANILIRKEKLNKIINKF